MPQVKKPRNAELTSAGIFIRRKGPELFQVQLGEHWIDVVKSEGCCEVLYTVEGQKTARGYAPLRRMEDIKWVESAVDSVAKKDEIENYSIRTAL
jgi:hypothetical protein